MTMTTTHPIQEYPYYVQDLCSTFPSSAQLEMAVDSVAPASLGTWDQSAATCTSHASYQLNEALEHDFDIDFALQLDAWLSEAPPTCTYPSNDAGTMYPGNMQASMTSFTTTPFYSPQQRAWSPTSGNCGSSFGSPTLAMTPSTATLNTPCSTPPMPQEHCYSEPTCFETFTKMDEPK